MIRKQMPRVAVSVPYPEGAIVQLSRYLAKNSFLESVISPSRAVNRMAGQVTKRVPGLGNFSGRLSRGMDTLPQLTEVMPTLELRRLFRVLTRSGVNLGESLNRGKAEFDAVVSRRIPAEANLIIGMPGAALKTFEHHPEVTRVLHEVDSHPAVHNALLLDAYPKSLISPYLHSKQHIERVTQEILLADYILTPSNFVSRQMENTGKDSDQIIQVPYGVDLTHFSPVDLPRHPSPLITLIYAGQIRYGKGLPFLFEAVRGMPNVQLRLVGPIVHPAVMESLPENCHYLGVMSTQTLVAHLNRSDAFIYPSLEDNFVLAVPEALACGLPVIVTNQVGAAEYLAPEDGVVVPSADSVALATAIRGVKELLAEERLARAESFRNRATDAKNKLGCSWEDYSAEVWAAVSKAVFN